MAVLRPAIVGLVAGAALAFVVALLRPRNRSDYLAAAPVTADPASER
jgi:hypothetical protein